MKQDTKSRDKPTQLWHLIYNIYNGEKTASSVNGTEKTGHLFVKNEIRTFLNTIHKNELKMD